ncbi:ABC transporter ATP-binding protein [Sinirhodobacter populi]|uniref:ABC transporter ATP-binding protein n=1 Tax=Paenirhodobacter populi TaxID=2306993 RepID=A0A443K5E2_9RHOB|nr:ABC transporter ATP-binding protein [Sinirhodobacter populi]RWR27945.1 ABC transporter ATP-binding protein [Sinirhodobacter populi]
MTLLDLKNLRISIPTERGLLNAVRGVDLALKSGETLCLVGESGCGKSLTAMTLMGLGPKTARTGADRFTLLGHDMVGKKPKAWSALRGRGLSVIFQDPMTSLNPTLTVGRQLTEGVIRSEGITRREADIRAIELLERVGIARPGQRLGQYPHQFSGGQRQRLMIAMALMSRPKFLIADEPTTALDVTIQAQILTVLAGLQRDLGLGLLLITHDLGVVAAIADRVAVMYAGRIVEEGLTDTIFRTPAHPYTAGLMAAIPVPGRTRRGMPLPAIPGRVPGLIGEVRGCAFCDRCARALPVCAQVAPPVVQVQGHPVECHLYATEGAQ